MTDPSHDPSIEHEPHFSAGRPKLAVSGPTLPRNLGDAPPLTPATVDHTIWDEPALSSELVGAPAEDQLTYARWLTERIASTTFARSMGVTLLLIACAGMWGILGAVLSQFQVGALSALSVSGLFSIVIIGPVTEEITKVALALWVVEKRPYLFRAMWQILLAATAGGVLFGVIENLIYLHVYIPDAAPALARWRWSVCLALHTLCSFVAGLGLERIWRHAIRTRTPPQLGKGFPYFVFAMVGHGLYNLTVTLAELGGWLKFE